MTKHGSKVEMKDDVKGDVTANTFMVPDSKEEEVDAVESGSSSSQELGYDEKQTKKLIRKIDWALLPFLALLYLLSFLDRSAFPDTHRNEQRLILV